MSTLYGAPDVVWYEPGAISVSPRGLIAMTTGASVIFARLEHAPYGALPPSDSEPEAGKHHLEAKSEDGVAVSAEDDHPVDRADAASSMMTPSEKTRLVFVKKLNIHSDKCRSVEFSREKTSADRERLVILLVPSTIKVIDYPTMEVVFSEEFPSTVPIRAMRFFDDRPQALALGLVSGELTIVDLASNSSKRTERSGRLQIKTAQEELQDMDVSLGRAVLGFSKGSVAVVDLHTWKVIFRHKLSGHVRCVRWNPSGTVIAAMAVGEKGPFIITDISGSKPSSATDATPPPSFIVPLPSKAIRGSSADKSLLSASVCWLGDHLVVGTPSGTVCSGKFQGKDTRLELIPQELLSKSICCLYPVSLSHGLVLSSGIDRQLGLWDVVGSPDASAGDQEPARRDRHRRLLRCQTGLSGFVYDMAFHPAGTGVLAVATGSGSVLLAKTDQAGLEQAGKHLQLRCRLYGVAWHPTNEMQLAVATQDGEVIVMDVSPQKTTVRHHRTNSHIGVGSVAFASLPLISERPVLLAANGSHVYFARDSKGNDALQNLASLVNDLNNHKIWCIGPVPEKNLLLLGTFQGKVLAVDSVSLQILAETRLEKTAVTRLVVSPGGRFVAAVFSAPRFSVFDCEQFRTNGTDSGNPNHCSSPPSLEPVEPKIRILYHSCMAFCWSPFDEDLFAIGGNTGDVELWSLRKGLQRIFHRVSGNKSILALCWSPIEEKRIFLGTNSNSLYQLDIDDFSPKEPVNCTVDTELAARQQEDNQEAPPVRTGGSKTAKKTSLFPLSSNSENTPKAEGLEDLLLILSCERSGDFSSLAAKPHLGFFYRELIQETLQKEAERHSAKLNNDLALQVLLTGGDIRSTLEFAKERKQLTHQLVTLSAFVSKEFFNQTVSAFIDQNKASDIYSVLPLMVASGLTGELLQLLCERNLHREAAAVALSHGVVNENRDSSDKENAASGDSNNSEALKDVYRSWAARYCELGQNERAARCYLVTGEHQRAVDVLTLCQDLPSVATAAIVAKRCGLPSEVLLLRAIRALLASPDSSSWLQKVADEFDIASLTTLGALARIVRDFYAETKPRDEESENHSFTAPLRSLEELLSSHRGSLSDKNDASLIKKLVEGAQPPQSVHELQALITLDVAESVMASGLEADSSELLNESAKVKISRRVAQFEMGKGMHFVMAMLQKPQPDTEVSRTS